MRAIGSDRGRFWKGGAAVLLALALHRCAYERGVDFQPDYGSCALQPERNDGRRVWVGGNHYVPQPDGSAILTMTIGHKVRLIGPILPEPPRPWTLLYVQGIFRADPPRVEVEKFRAIEGFPWKRRAMVIASALILAACLWLASREFAWERGTGWVLRGANRA
ncbi:MAG: hypothetical protein HY608_00950 [Planctomycetes bacterium]|nr:hypothetical protein [Planctomycetota bacterium]